MIAFAGSPLDRAEAMRRDEPALARAAAHPDARWLLFHDLKPLMLGEGGSLGIAWFERDAVPPDAPSFFLGFEGAAPRFAAVLPEPPASGAMPVDARAAAMHGPTPALGIIAHARSLIDWHAGNRFCASCGGATTMARGGAIRCCAGCATEHYPRVNPVVIMLVCDGEAVLLGRGPRMPPRFLSALAGFVEPGESLEEAVRRETFEEVGVAVGAVRYVASQPWPFPSSLMVGFHAAALSRAIRIDPHEVEEARWVSRAELGAAIAGEAEFVLPPPLAIARHLIDCWLAQPPVRP